MKFIYATTEVNQKLILLLKVSTVNHRNTNVVEIMSEKYSQLYSSIVIFEIINNTNEILYQDNVTKDEFYTIDLHSVNWVKNVLHID